MVPIQQTTTMTTECLTRSSPKLFGRVPLEVTVRSETTFDRELTNPLGSPPDVLSPTWINTGPVGSAFSNPFDIPTQMLTTSGWSMSVLEVTGDGSNWVSVASLIGMLGSWEWSNDSAASFSVDVVLDASPFSTTAADDFCLFLFFFFRFFAAAIWQRAWQNRIRYKLYTTRYLSQCYSSVGMVPTTLQN